MLAHGSPAKAIAMIVVGVLLGLVGVDVNSGAPRMTFGIPDLNDGIGFVPIAIGLFGIAEMIHNLEQPQDRSLLSDQDANLWPSWAEISALHSRRWCAAPRSARCSACCRAAARRCRSFAAYALEKKIAADPSRFGQRRDRGRRRAGSRQQCRRADELHSDADARHSRQRR